MAARHERGAAVRLAFSLALLGTIGAFVVEAGLDPVATVFWRCVFGTLSLSLWCLVKGYLPEFRMPPRRLLRTALVGLCIVANWVLFFASYPLTSIATTTIVYHIHPFFMILLGVAFLGERVTRAQLSWLGLAFLGLVLASGAGTHPATSGGNWPLGIALTLGSALLYACAQILAKGLGGQRGEVTALCQTVIGMVLLAPFAHFLRPLAPAAWPWLASLGIFHTGLAFALMYGSYPRLATPVIGVLAFLYPATAILVDWSIYGHRLAWTQAVGLVLIMTGTLAVRLGWRFGFRPGTARP